MPELSVSRKTIGKLLSDMQGKKFIIPDFQRPYNWDIEKCETLWEDIENFTNTEAKQGTEYFLGTIVSYVSEEKNQEIIDGQQRLTSFFLMLRAFFKKLEDMQEDDDVKGLKNQVAPCIWDINPISQKVTDQTKIHIESQVATEEDNEVLHYILETGRVSGNGDINYEKNYSFFKSKCDKYAEDNPMQWKELCVTILQKCIVLPIECDTMENALTIFSTLNDRGMPLSDSDIFKAQIYRNFESKKERKAFTEDWKTLTQICASGGFEIDDVFRYYSHAIRARNSDKSKEIGLRRFYSLEKSKKLKDPILMPEIMCLARFWKSVNKETEPDEEADFDLSFGSRKYFHCLFNYPNEFWRYATSVFYLKNKGSVSFDQDLQLFLAKLVAFLFAKYIDRPSVNAIKDDIYIACISIMTGNELKIRFKLDETEMVERIPEYSTKRIARSLLLLYAYLNADQKELITSTFDVEHIFPKKWQDTNYNGWDIDDAWDYLERFGNKVVLEKKLNIQAGNGYFGVKKDRYAESDISTVLELSNYPNNDWVKEDIEKREKSFVSDIVEFFKVHLPTE